MPKIWTNSGDSHFLEPADLWESRLPRRLADLTPKPGKDPDRQYEPLQAPRLEVADGGGELGGGAGQGFQSVFLPATPHPSAPDWHRDDWEPFWAAAERAGMVLAIHIGTDPVDMAQGKVGVTYRGPGGAV